ncbi:uncharacterized protein TrAtP1_008518 [Trichoderma atroviride]|uniref:Uncharacterized protein n=1 Tax=Hypocrea atroviridis (strain ATCC 20476 / IMI 206040) TaxID=452589 RepID=G9NZZ9_HYPAI|nr:uncharacterized protein TRIATDRAFT_300386 [Trichoderma atroviride IMI 206040]EHK44045.1 hypothetical protein TRIATDRAFT_300386 [Trichoderma atroviride IMI 206040]UKZ67357.1 hypothetical protein TrAtP1_008518 [Trichoderma atroviride]
MSEPLTKVDSAVQGLSSSPPKEKGHRRTSSSAAGVMTINEINESHAPLKLAVETQQTAWKINQRPKDLDNDQLLMIPLTAPPIKSITLKFPHGKEVVARNMKGLTIGDALSAIHKANKNRADDELDNPYLKGFAWDQGENYFEVHLQSQPATGMSSGGGGGKKKKKNKDADE